MSPDCCGWPWKLEDLDFKKNFVWRLEIGGKWTEGTHAVDLGGKPSENTPEKWSDEAGLKSGHDPGLVGCAGLQPGQLRLKTMTSC